MELNIGDTIENVGVITRLSEHSVWVDNKLFKRSTIENRKPLNMISKFSRDIDIDWSDENQVDKYYKSFVSWQGILRMVHSKKCGIFEVKNNKIFFEGEYYLPYYHASHIITNVKIDKVFIPDCKIFGYVLKLKNRMYDSMEGGTLVNVFHAEGIVSKETDKYIEDKTIAKAKLSTVEYLRYLDLTSISSDELNMLRNDLQNLFEVKFPFTVKFKNGKNVTFQKGSFNRIEVIHRSRTGHLKMDNGYKGRQPYGLDYYAILKVEPYFTNESQYTDGVRVEKKFKFNAETLTELAIKVVKVWDKAIENNARHIG